MVNGKWSNGQVDKVDKASGAGRSSVGANWCIEQPTDGNWWLGGPPTTARRWGRRERRHFVVGLPIAESQRPRLRGGSRGVPGSQLAALPQPQPQSQPQCLCKYFPVLFVPHSTQSRTTGHWDGRTVGHWSASLPRTGGGGGFGPDIVLTH